MGSDVIERWREVSSRYERDGYSWDSDLCDAGDALVAEVERLRGELSKLAADWVEHGWESYDQRFAAEACADKVRRVLEGLEPNPKASASEPDSK